MPVFFALVIRQENRNFCTQHYIIRCLQGCTILFPHYLINGTIFGEKLLNIKCVFWFSLQLLSETFLTLRRIQRDMFINVHTSPCNVPVLLVKYLFKFDFLHRFLKTYSNTKFNENPSIRSRVFYFFHEDRQTNVTKLIFAFYNFENAPKSQKLRNG